MFAVLLFLSRRRHGVDDPQIDLGLFLSPGANMPKEERPLLYIVQSEKDHQSTGDCQFFGRSYPHAYLAQQLILDLVLSSFSANMYYSET